MTHDCHFAGRQHIDRLCVSSQLALDFMIAAFCQDEVESFVFKHLNLAEALEGLDRFSDSVEFVLGRNFIPCHARPLKAAKRDLRLQNKSIIDTLWLDSLAFPRNRYPHLVKHYQDGRLQAGHVND